MALASEWSSSRGAGRAPGASVSIACPHGQHCRSALPAHTPSGHAPGASLSIACKMSGFTHESLYRPEAPRSALPAHQKSICTKRQFASRNGASICIACKMRGFTNESLCRPARISITCPSTRLVQHCLPTHRQATTQHSRPSHQDPAASRHLSQPEHSHTVEYDPFIKSRFASFD